MKKFFIKFLISIFLILYSFNVFAAVNDIYYCEMDNLILIKDDKYKAYQEQKFKFKRLKNELQFGSEENYFKNFTLPITFSAGETFSAADTVMATFSYMDGKFHYAASTYDKAYAIDGNCSIF